MILPLSQCSLLGQSGLVFEESQVLLREYLNQEMDLAYSGTKLGDHKLAFPCCKSIGTYYKRSTIVYYNSSHCDFRFSSLCNTQKQHIFQFGSWTSATFSLPLEVTTLKANNISPYQLQNTKFLCAQKQSSLYSFYAVPSSGKLKGILFHSYLLKLETSHRYSPYSDWSLLK